MGRLPGAEPVEQAVRDWITQEVPGEPALAANAARRAASAYLRGDTVSGACGAALRYVRSWYHHPSHRRVGAVAVSLVP